MAEVDVYASISQIDSGAFNPVVAAGTAPDSADASSKGTGMAKWVYCLVILEALLGQFFVAVLVARLVGLLQTQLSAE